MSDPASTDPLAPEPEPTDPASIHRGVRRFSAAELLGALILLIVVAPFLERIPEGDLVESLLMSVVLGAAALLIGGRRRMLVINLGLAVPAVAGRWAHHIWPETFSGEFALAAGLLFSVFAVANILRYIMRAPRVDSEVLCAGIASYLLLGVLWAFAYMLVVSVDPQAITFSGAPMTHAALDGFDAFYFSFCTLSTVGYGDITPVSHVARMLAAMEAMTGMLYVGMLIARLVAVYSKEGPVAPAN